MDWRRRTRLPAEIRVSIHEIEVTDRTLTHFSGLAEGVVESAGPVDDSTTMQFYSSDDCNPGTEFSRADAGCLTVDQGVVGVYKSFQVVASTVLDSPSSKRRSPDQRRYPFPHPSTTRAIPPAPQIDPGMQLSFEGADYKLC